MKETIYVKKNTMRDFVQEENIKKLLLICQARACVRALTFFVGAHF